MSLVLTIKIACKNIISNRLRSGLTILGLVIGIASVIILVGIGNGASGNVREQVSSLGTDIITVNITSTDNALSYSQVEDMKKISLVKGVSPYVTISSTISKNGSISSKGAVFGTGESYTDMMDYELEHGREMSKIDVDHSTKVAIIGHDIAQEFWGTANPCGDTLKLDGDEYTVIGTLKSVGASMGNQIDSVVIIPISSARYLGANTSVNSLYVRADGEGNAEMAADALEQYLEISCGIDENNYSVTTQEMMQEAMKEINQTLSLLLGGIAGISLLVGGIGVMNVMLVSVTERTKEIGIRKSLGARRRDILFQFLIESMVLSVIGGIIGIVVGIGGGMAATAMGASFLPGMTMIIVSFIVSVAVGLIFGIFPSYRAAKMKPVDALRYE